MTSALLLILLLLLVVALGTTLFLLKRVPAGSAGVVERLGTYHRTLPPGLHVMLPGDKIRRVELAEQSMRVQDEPLSSDAVPMSAVADVAYRVVDAHKATYEITNYPMAVEQLTRTALRNLAEGRDAETLLVSSGHVTEQLRLVLSEALPLWGIEPGRVDVTLSRDQPR